MGTFCLLNSLCPRPKLELCADGVLYKWFWLWWRRGPEMTVARRKLINPAALMLARVPVLIVFDSKIHPYLAAGWCHGMLASVQIDPGKEPRLLAHLKEQYLGTVTPESFPSGGLPCTVSHFRELSRECFDDPTFRGQGHHLLHSLIPRDGELRGLANWWTKGQQARTCIWLGAAYQPLIWRGAILTGLLDPNETINTETSFQAQSLEGASRTTWITFAVGWPNSKQSGPN